jgi:hypothetical protein
MTIIKNYNQTFWKPMNSQVILSLIQCFGNEPYLTSFKNTFLDTSTHNSDRCLSKTIINILTKIQGYLSVKGGVE